MLKETLSQQIKETNHPYLVKNWAPEDAQNIFIELETPNWAPWLAASVTSIKGRSLVFPKGQLLLMNKTGSSLASLSTNQIQWDGNPDALPNWDTVAGEPTTYENTYNLNGNTLILMSMNVHPTLQGKGLARALIGEVKKLAQELGITHLIGSFRPSQFGAFKASGNWNVQFEEYCQMKQIDGWPVDGWLRSLMKNGMTPLKVDHQAMTVSISIEEFSHYQQTHKPEVWKEVIPGIWECGEVGQWKVDTNQNLATYQESNLWGMLSVK